MEISKIKAGRFHIDNGQAVLRSEDYQNFLSTRKAVQLAREDAEKTHIQAQQAYQKACEQGYQKGVEQAKQDMIERHIELVAQAIEFTADLERKIFDLITLMMRKIVGQIDIDELTKQIITETLSEYGTLPEIKLQVAASQEQIARDKLKTLVEQRGRAAGIKFVTIEVDEHMQSGDCVLESPIGSVDASLDTQLAALEAALEQIPYKNIKLKKDENDGA